MKAFSTLPDGYQLIDEVDLQKDKKTALLVNLGALIIALVLALPMHYVVPIQTLFSMEKGLLAYSLRFAIFILLMILYIVLHELIHGAAMKLCGTKKVKYGFTGLYAFAGSADYYDKTAYLLIALAPVVLFGLLLALVCPFVSREWFWVAYGIQINNLSGAAGDLLVTFRFSRLPGDILVQDSGVGMQVYSKK